MAEPTRAVTMSPRERASIVNILLNAGHSVDNVMIAVDQGRWGALPWLPADYRNLKCPSCGKMPDRDEFSGRMSNACFGQCLQQQFADDKDRSLAGRADRVAAAAKDKEEDSVFLSIVREHQPSQLQWLDLD